MSAAPLVPNISLQFKVSKSALLPETEGVLIQRRVQESEEDFTKRRNNLYSRRRNQKTKLGLISLHDERCALTNANAALRRENERLVNLVAQAQAMVALEPTMLLENNNNSNNNNTNNRVCMTT